MKKRNIIYTLILSALFCASAIFQSCTLETSGNGKLDGYWHLIAVDTIATGGTCDLSQKRLFWGVQAKIINMSDRDNRSCDFLLRFEHVKTILRVYSPLINDRSVGDTPVDNAEVLKPFGIEALEQSFKIETLKSKRMTLVTDKLKLHFYKM